MFARPDSGSEPCSYPVPTPTAAFGIMQSILRVKSASIQIEAIGICHRPEYLDYAFNSWSSIRKEGQKRDGNACQIKATALLRPRFQICATAKRSTVEPPHPKYAHINCAHSYRDQFYRRLSKEQYYRMPTLGPSDFFSDYVGLPITPIISDYNEILHGYVLQYFDKKNGYIMQFPITETLRIAHGILQLGPEKVIAANGILKFENENLNK